MNAEKVLGVLFGAAREGRYVEIRQVPPGISKLTDAGDPSIPFNLQGAANVYFGVCLRDSRTNIVETTIVWVDVDAPDQDFDVHDVLPTPTVVNTSGGIHEIRLGDQVIAEVPKVHIYWVLDEAVDPLRGVRLSKLGSLAWNGDHKVCEPSRVMRVPGSQNRKDPQKKAVCETVILNEGTTYSDGELEEQLVAAIILPLWDSGQRHGMALALGAVLARADWDAERIERCVRHLCSWAEDDEVGDRVVAAVGTVVRRDAGMLVSSADLKEALGDKYAPLVDALGITSRDGDLMYSGNRIGSIETLQRDLVNFIAGMELWAVADGHIVRWNDRYWTRVEKETVDSSVFTILTQLKIVDMGDEKDFNATANLAKSVSAMLTGRLAEKPLDPIEPEYLPVKNGVINLLNGDLLPPSPDFRNRWTLGIEYQPWAVCPVWKSFLEEAAPDEAKFLQEWVGYCLLEGNDFQRMLWLYGQTGTGKSTFLKVVEELFGPSAAAIRADTLTPYTIATLSPAKVALCSEMSNRVLKTAVLKSLVSGDVIEGRHPYGRPFLVKFLGKLIWGSNALPPVDQAEGMWRRIAVVEFKNVPKRVDPALGRKLRLEMSGVLNWALEGLAKVRKYKTEEDWPLPQSVINIVSEYQEAADYFKQFIRDEIQPDPEGTVTYKDVYQRYYAWCRERGIQPEAQGPIFWRELRNAGLAPQKPQKVKGRTVRMWKGGTLVPETWKTD